MRPRSLVAAAALALALPPHVPAQAALPKFKPTETMPCPNNPKKSLRIWASKAPFAVDNPCSDWFVMEHPGGESSDSTYQTVNVAGYSKVNLPLNMKTRNWWWEMSPLPMYCRSESGTTSYYGDGHRLILNSSENKRNGDGLGCRNDF
jgi:hypothetical protein